MIKKFWVVDTEDNSQGELYWINFYDGIKHYAFKTALEAQGFMKSIQGHIWAVNAGYDIANIFKDDYSKLELCFIKSRFIFARFSRAYIFDTLNHWKLSVEEMGKRLGFRKLLFEPENLKYCQRDCEVTYMFIEEMLKRYDDIGMKIKSTLPSSVHGYWKEKYNFVYGKTLTREILDDLRLAYYGGRTECFHIGKVKNNIQYIDINSMYPACMLGDLPFPYSFQKNINIQMEGITNCKVRSNMDIPILPYRDKTGKLIFPNGMFEGTWTNNELRYFISEGGEIIKSNFGYTFPVRCYPYEEFIIDIFQRRKTTKDEFLKLIYKLMMNSLYGKHGQGNVKSYFMSKEKYLALPQEKMPDQAQVYGNIVTFEIEGEYPRQTNFIMPAYVTSRSRIKLHGFLKLLRASGRKILYCDTDSIMFQGDTLGLPLSDKLGDFKLEGTYKDIEIKTCKMYKLTDINDESFIKCKGVPSKEQATFFSTGTANYKKPTRIKESLRRNLKPNIWIDHKKVMIEKYGKGIILKDGTVKPHKLK